MNFSRRGYLRANAAAIAAAIVGIDVPVLASNPMIDADRIALQWSKAPCPFCGSGCSGVMGINAGRMVPTHGDLTSEANRGLDCVKGYFLSKIIRGKDRLTSPLLRMKGSRFDHQGEFRPVTWEQAFDVMAEKFKQVLRKKGPTAIRMVGSGHWTVWEGYAAAKLMKAGFRSNNIAPDARHCMPATAGGLIRTCGIGEPLGCYDDLEHADAFVLWGANVAEAHPTLWTRLANRRLSAPHVKVAVLSTSEHRCFELADIPMVFRPQTDLAILNYIANHLIQSGRVDETFVGEHVDFRRSHVDDGYGLRPQHPDDPGRREPLTFESYKDFVSRYTLGYAHENSGLPRSRLEQLAAIYADPSIKVMSVWTTGCDQHSRGAWCARLLHNIHLLTGNIAALADSPFPLMARTSARGTARRSGAFAQGPPADPVLSEPEHLAIAEEIWELPAGIVPEEPEFHAAPQNRMLKDGVIDVCWIQTNNGLQAATNTSEETHLGYRNPENFVVVSDAYPTVIAIAADLILPSAMWVEKEGTCGSAERRTQFWHQLVEAPGQSRSELWQTVEFAKRFTTDEVWPDEILDANPEYRGKSLYDVLFKNGQVDRYPLEDMNSEYGNDEAQALGFYIQKALFEEYVRLGRGLGYDIASFAFHDACRLAR